MKQSSGLYEVHLFGGPEVLGPNGIVSLSPFQAALVGIVYAQGSISREDIARVLWRDDPDSAARQRIRQLVHTVRTRTRPDFLVTDGDFLRTGVAVGSDLEALERNVQSGPLLDAARSFEKPFLGKQLPGLSGAFDDWRRAREAALRTRVLKAAEAGWSRATATSDWARARDAAEARFRLDRQDISSYTNLIEARGRTGRLRSAESAYAEFQRSPLQSDPESGTVDRTIRRVREALREVDSYMPAPETPLVGRGAALARLRPALDDIKDGRFTFGLVSGEAGIGKTRVLDALRQEAVMSGFLCLHARSVELERRISLNPMLDALGGVDLESHLAALGEPWRTVIGRTLPPGMLAAPLQELPAIEDRSLSRRLFDAFSLLLQRIADDTPTVLFLDDFHWSDGTTIELIQFFQRRWQGARLGVLASIRPEAIEHRDRVAAYIADDSKLVSYRAHLEELEEVDARLLLSQVSGGKMGQGEQSRLLEIAGCHPLYLTELTREFLVGDLQLSEEAGAPMAIPVSLRQIVASRRSGLTEAATSVANVLAVGSRAMRLHDLAAVSDMSPEVCADAAEELRAHRLAQVDRDRVWIIHDLFRSALYTDLSETRRAILHRRFAEHLLSEGAEGQEGELATHFERAGESDRAVEFAWLAGDRAMTNGAMAEAALFFDRAARREADPVRRATAAAKKAEALFLGRDIARANPALELAAAGLREVGKAREARRLDALRVRGLAEAGDTPMDDVLERIRAVLQEARDDNDWDTLALALDAEVQFLILDERLELALSRTVELREVARSDSPSARATAHGALAIALMLRSSSDALDAAMQAVRLTPHLASGRRLSALNRLLIVLVHQGRVHLPENAAFLVEAQALADRTGDLMQRASYESNVAVSYMDAGDADRAEHRFDKVDSLLGNADMTFLRVNLACNRGELGLRRGDYEGAKQWFESAAVFQGAASPKYSSDAANAGIGLCALQIGDLAEARRRELALNPAPTIWYYDPTVTASFVAKLMERRGHRRAAIELLDQTIDDVEGRLVPAWLKLKLIQAELLAKERSPRGPQVVLEALEVARDLQLSVRVKEFTRILERVTPNGT